MTEVYLVDSSAWIEWIRGTGSPAHLEVRRLVRTEPGAVTITEPVVMELLAGAKSPTALSRLTSLTAALPRLPLDSSVDFHEAATIFRAMRSAGTPVRSMIDCLIAAVAVRTGATVLHRDHDFDQIGRAVRDLRTRSVL